MTVTVAKTAGFCYGVKRAVELAQQAAQDGKPCVMLGPIIHNAHVVDALAEQGIGCVNSPEEVPEGSRVIIRSHGESQAVYEQLRARHRGDADAPGGGGHRRVVPAGAGGGVRPGIGRLAARSTRTASSAPHVGLPDNFHKRNLGFGHKKSKKRVYKRRNF